ncbi:mitotic spindle checkpoint protein mad2 [Quercus suber]|uniref:Mitotic spindle checkpoint protein MAD2 n=1 Tax=Quercus suber TaxID=58331 RepID=A0AAW0LF77_QUESU
MASRTVTKDIITLRGSAAIVSEFFGYAANSILYNRGLYPEESFVKVKKYGLPMLLIQDESVKSFIANVTAQLSEWLEAGKLQRIVLVIMSKATNEVLERWNFSIETDSEVVEKGVSREKSDKEIMREIQAIMRQIASSITYLPCLDEACKNHTSFPNYFNCGVFDVLAYTDKDIAVPFTWIESDPKLIANPQMVKLHSFDTKIHKVDTLVSYKNDEWDEQ